MTTAESNLRRIKKVSTKDREYIQSGLEMLGPDPIPSATSRTSSTGT